MKNLVGAREMLKRVEDRRGCVVGWLRSAERERGFSQLHCTGRALERERESRERESVLCFASSL